ncbi:MAG: CAAX prenyl protease-related protein [Phycisphaerae bacterium]
MGFYDQPSPPPVQRSTWNQWLTERPQLPYLLPFLVFVIIGFVPSKFGHAGGIDWQKLWFTYLPVVYASKTAVGAILLILWWKYYTPIRWRNLGLGALVGLVGVPLWIGLEYLSQRVGYGQPPSSTDPYAIYNPLVQIPDANWRALFYLIRVGGPTLVVPIMEELFFRDFIMRFLVRGARFQDVEVGAFDRHNSFSWFSLLGMSVLFAINHIQQPSGLAYGLLMGVLLIRTKSLGACIVAHGVTNLVLYVFVIYQGTMGNNWYWQFM